jgi:hypothetical protein
MPVNIVPTLRYALRRLEAEKRQVDSQIAALRGAVDSVDGTGQRRARRRMSASARAAVSRRMKAYWAKRRAGKKKSS